MNVIISNKYQMLLANLDIAEIQDNVNGEFTAEDLINRYKNEWYQKMILDVTALKDYENINTIQRLSLGLDMSKVILLLDDSPKVNSPLYLSQLVSMGIYNFTKNVDSITYLMSNPNSYKDVACYHQLDNAILENNPKNKVVEDNINTLGQKIIGIKNVTEHAGSTTLCYLFKKHLEKQYKVKAIEVDSNDFKFFGDRTLVSTSSSDLKNVLDENKDLDAIIVDIPIDGSCDLMCTEVIYLIETGFIQLNKLVSKNQKIFEELKNKKIILNKCPLEISDITVFENESGSKVFASIPYLNDKNNNIKDINELLASLGFTRIEVNSFSKKGFGLFK